MTIRSRLSVGWAIIRLAAVPAIIVWLLVAAKDGVALPARIDAGWLVLALIFNEAALALFGVRMQLLLSAFEVPIRWLDALRIHLESVFYYFVVPMTVGIEVARFAKIRIATPGTPVKRILPALLLDRLVGAGSAAALAMIVWPLLRFDAAPWIDASSAAVWFVFAVLAAITAALFFPAMRRLALEVLRTLRASWRRVSVVFLFSILMHGVFALSILCAARALLIDVTFVEVAFAVAAGMLLVAVPISLGGVGAADVTTTAIFVAMGHPFEQSVLLGALPYLARLVGAVQGGIWEMAEGAESIARTRMLLRSGKIGAGET